MALYEEGARYNLEFYRRISVLLVMSEILEKAVQDQLIEFLESNKPFSNYQCKSCTVDYNSEFSVIIEKINEKSIIEKINEKKQQIFIMGEH